VGVFSWARYPCGVRHLEEAGDVGGGVELWWLVAGLQGYLAHKKTPTPLGLP